MGYIHRSIEKMCESLSFRQFIYRPRGWIITSHINNHGCALAVEQGLGVEIPERAQVIRVIGGRVDASGIAPVVGAMAMDVGRSRRSSTPSGKREMINDIMEETCGARLTMNYMVPGGVMFDLHPNFQRKGQGVSPILNQSSTSTTSWSRIT